jgi:hypothetical protein
MARKLRVPAAELDRLRAEVLRTQRQADEGERGPQRRRLIRAGGPIYW